MQCFAYIVRNFLDPLKPSYEFLVKNRVSKKTHQIPRYFLCSSFGKTCEHLLRRLRKWVVREIWPPIHSPNEFSVVKYTDQ